VLKTRGGACDQYLRQFDITGEGVLPGEQVSPGHSPL
jgi:hypothetical protein